MIAYGSPKDFSAGRSSRTGYFAGLPHPFPTGRRNPLPVSPSEFADAFRLVRRGSIFRSVGLPDYDGATRFKGIGQLLLSILYAPRVANFPSLLCSTGDRDGVQCIVPRLRAGRNAAI